MEILTARPEYISFESYKEHLRRQNKWLKNKLKPLVYYVSWRQRRDEKGEHIGCIRFLPFVGSAKHDLRKPV